MTHRHTSPPRSPTVEPRRGTVPVNTDEQPAGPEAGPLQSTDKERKLERDDSLMPPPQPQDDDV